jgi:hypothetical protein
VCGDDPKEVNWREALCRVEEETMQSAVQSFQIDVFARQAN